MLRRVRKIISNKQFEFSSSNNSITSSMFNDLQGHGFLPSTKPLLKLPNEFNALNQILDDMTFWQKNGTASGLLAKNHLRSTVDLDFPDLSSQLQKVDKSDARLITALFRDYSMLTAAYLLEPCHLNYLKTGHYGRGMSFIPEKLALPMKYLADLLQYKQPLLDYAHGYALNNWQFVNDPTPNDIHYKNEQIVTDINNPNNNISLIRKLNGCKDEAGFILLHVAIVSKSNKQCQSYEIMYDGLQKNDRALFNKGMEQHLQTLQEMNDIFRRMWNVSNPKGYLNFRTFIMGVKGNDEIFPGGVIYKGLNNNEPLSYRGETGAQDSIIPCVDSALGVEYPRNSLTEYLFQLRDYRPYHHQNYMNSLKSKTTSMALKQYAMQDSESALLLLNNLHVSFKFRHQHWGMVKKYIIDNTKYARATGGTPITTWLPNQIGAVLEFSQQIINTIDLNKLDQKQKENLNEIKSNVQSEINYLFNEVKQLQEEFNNQELDQFQTRKQ